MYLTEERLCEAAIRQTDIHTGGQRDRQTDIHTDGQRDMQTDRQTDIRTHRQTGLTVCVFDRGETVRGSGGEGRA